MRRSVEDSIVRVLCVAATLTFLTSAASAQSPAVLEQFEELHQRLVTPDEVVARADALKASDRLAEWRLDRGELTAETRVKLLQLRIVVALADANAHAALEHSAALLQLAPDDALNLKLGFIAGSAAGDAKLALDRLKLLSRKLSAAQRREYTTARRQLRFVGDPAPSVEIRTQDDTAYSANRRAGKVLVIDFWNMLRPPTEPHLAALKSLHEAYKHDRYVEFVGVNADSETRTPNAKQFVEVQQLPWKNRFEFAAIKAPITHQAFHAGSPPWCVIIDSLGYVRAIGAADEPRFQYALRAAVAEASGKRPLLAPRNRAGDQPKLPGESEPQITGSDSTQGKTQADGDLPSNVDAQAKLRRARTYLKAKSRRRAKALFQEIVSDYPGTLEAKQAQEYLDSL